MNTPKKIVIIAGEESGDLHAANMVTELLAENPSLQISGIGGRHMQNAGVELVSDLARFGVTGFTAVFRHALVIKRAFTAIKAHLKAVKPDLLILVDYPGFNLRLAKFARCVPGLRILYYISPQIWAWKAKRINTIQACIDRMAVILPFEKQIYQKAGVPVSFVGHPLLDKIPAYDNLTQIRIELGLPTDKNIVSLLPGSRRNEVDKHLPVLVDTIKLLSAKFDNLHFVIPIAGTLEPDKIKQYFCNMTSISFISGQAIKVAACSDCVVVASGTASLECALLLKPMCIIYKTSWLTYQIGKRLINVKYLGLCNLLQNKMIAPELIQHDCNPYQVAKTVEELLNNKQMSQQMLFNLKEMKQSLSAEKSDCSIAELVKQELYKAPA